MDEVREGATGRNGIRPAPLLVDKGQLAKTLFGETRRCPLICLGALAAARYLPQEAFVANTDRAWFDFLASRAAQGRVDEVNFWHPKATSPMRKMLPGEPIFFRLKSPDDVIAGYGFYAHFQVLDLDLAWQTFGEKNGSATREQFFEKIGDFRKLDLLHPASRRDPIGCTVLREAVFWPHARWIPWAKDRNWKPNIVQGRTERDAASVALLVSAIRTDQAEPPAELVMPAFELLAADERSLTYRGQALREGQGTFRLRLIQAYGRCAITGEHTQIVLDGAHIQPYLGPRSNHPQNGVLLTKEFHALFDAGYVTITPELRVRISERLRTDWHNGHRYYPFDGKPLAAIPSDKSLQPSRDALAWHATHKFLAA